MTRRIAAAIQIFIIVSIIAFGTYQLYRGNFEASLSTFPFLVIYYLFVTVRQKKLREQHMGDDEQMDDPGR